MMLHLFPKIYETTITMLIVQIIQFINLILAPLLSINLRI